jgi:microcystin-dependent protein
MTQTSQPYSSTSTDNRDWTAAQIAAFFRALLTDGIVKGKLGEFVVTAQSSPGMAVDVASGQGWVYGYFVKSTGVEAKTIDANTSGNPRIDTIILRNAVTGAKTITIEVLKGTPDPTPVPLPLTQTSDTYEIALTFVAVANGETEINTGDITDARSYTTLKYVRQSSLVHPANLDMGTQRIVNSADGEDDQDDLTKAQVDDQANYCNLPPGVEVLFGVLPVPAGFLHEDGSAHSRTTYAALFAVIGTKYGVGDGSTTFNVPNNIDKFIVGFDSEDADFDDVGKTGGLATVTLTEAEMLAHTHAGAWYAGVGMYSFAASSMGIGFPSGGTSGSTGGGGAHENMPPWIKLPWGIKT